MTLKEEFQTRNFNIYGQWIALLTAVLCFAFGIANLITTNVLHIILAALCLVFFFLIVFVEIKFLLRICPTSSTFDEKIRMINNAWMRAGFYAIESVVLWLSLITGGSTLVVPAVFLAITAVCYLLAALKNQEFIGSKTLGGAGIAQMIV